MPNSDWVELYATPTPPTHMLNESTLVDRNPINEFDALMRCAPGDEPEETIGDRQKVREVIADAIDRLTPEHRYVIDAINSERVSYADLAARLGVGKTQAWRITQAAQQALRTELLKTRLISERIRMGKTWNEACRAEVERLRPAGTTPDNVALQVIDRKIDQLRQIVHSKYAGNHNIDEAIVAKMRTIGMCAADILSNAGAWSVDDMVDLLCRKQHDYGHGNINAFGLIGIVVRTSDKVARYHNLKGKGGLAEPRIDAAVDMVGYAVIAMMIGNDTFKLPLEVSA